MDHRGELGRDATDAHLAASLSVAVRRLAVYRSLRRDAEREGGDGGGGGRRVGC